MQLIDFHCHLDLYPDPEEAIAEVEELGVRTLTVTTTPKAWPRNHEMTASAQCVRAALGLHPQLVAERSHELVLFEKYLPATRYVGEVGLDAGPRFFRSLDLQKQVFERILRLCAEAGDKILSVHSVRSTKAVLDLIELTQISTRGRIVLHWFTGSMSEARRACDLGCYFSVNWAMLQSESGRKIIDMIPLHRLLTETDGPFTVISGQPAHPRHIALLINELATRRSTSPAQLASEIVFNLRSIVNLVETLQSGL